ncbi:hypothetical protein MBLNU230_g1124t1 [Neophaeotheca triangularis]
MPRHVIARNSEVHRTAAIALYRALLSQCQLVPTTQHIRENARNIIRNRFRQVTHLGSARRLRVAFQAGYEAVDKLDAAVAGHEDSKRYLEDLVGKAPERIKQPWEYLYPLKKRPAEETPQSANVEPPKRKVEFSERPLPLEKLSGKRHVPHLVNANHVPILRFKKPQPENLSGYISKQVKRRQRRHDRRHLLEDSLQLARFEDGWENLMQKQLVEEGERMKRGVGTWSRGKAAGADRSDSYLTPIRQAMKATQQALDTEKRKNKLWAEKLQGVVDREQAQLERDLVNQKQAGRDRRYLRWCRRKGLEPNTAGTALSRPLSDKTVDEAPG